MIYRKIHKTGKWNSYCLTLSITSGLKPKFTRLKFIELQSDQMELLLALKKELSVTNHITASFSCINMLAGSVDLSLITLGGFETIVLLYLFGCCAFSSFSVNFSVTWVVEDPALSNWCSGKCKNLCSKEGLQTILRFQVRNCWQYMETGRVVGCYLGESCSLTPCQTWETAAFLLIPLFCPLLRIHSGLSRA